MDVPIEELGGESLLQGLPRLQYEGRTVPALSGIPLLSKIGDGAAGTVYLGMLLPEKKPVAVKAIEHSDIQNPDRRRRFLDHLKAAANVTSPNLVEMFDGGSHAHAFFVVTEYVDGISGQAHLAKLKERLRPGMSEAGALDTAIAAVTGLAAAHQADVLHLDIRPSSILIPKAADGALDFANAKLCDLGLAWNDSAARMLNGSPAQTGTPGFMSPEQCVGAQDLGKGSDVFAMGTTLYALLCGQPPFGGLSLSIVLSSTVVQEAGGVRTWRPDVSRTTARLIELCLQKSPSNRFADATVLLKALQIARGCLEGDTAAHEAGVKEIEALVSPVAVKAKLLETIFPTHAVAGAPATEPVSIVPPEAAPMPDAAVTMLKPPANLEAQIVQPSNPTMPAVEETPLEKPIEEEPDPALRSEPRAVAAASGTLKAVTNTDIFNDLLKKKNEAAQPPADSSEQAAGEDEQLVDKQEPAAALAPPSVEVKESPRTVAVPPPDEWVDPALQYEEQAADEQVVAPKRRGGRGILVAAVLLLAVGAGAWQLGYLDQWLNASAKKNTQASATPKPPEPTNETPQPPPQENVPPSTTETKQPDTPAPVQAVTPTPAENPVKPVVATDEPPKPKPAAIIIEDTPPPEPVVAKVDPAVEKKAEEERLAAARKAEEERKAAEAKKEEERKAAEAAKKAEEERKAAEAAKKAEEERKAAEAAKKAEEERKVAEAAKKAEEERKAAEAAKKAEEEKKLAEATRAAEAKKAEEERKAAEAKRAEDARKAEAEKLAAESRARAEREEAARRKKEEADRVAAMQKPPASRTAPAAAPKPPAPNMPREVSLDLGGSVSMEFVLVPAGSFSMGTSRPDLAAICLKEGADTKDYQDESPSRRVDVATFYMQKTPVTVAQFRRFVETTKYQTSAERVGAAFVLQDRKWQKVPGACWKNPGFEQKDDHPVVMLSFRDCEAFATWVAQLTSRPVRIPGETEWEYAARGSNNTLWPWGNVWNGKLANHSDKRLRPFCQDDWNYSKADDGFPFTSPVGAFQNASWCGALDMAGNVFQWCSDIYEPYPQSNTKPQISMDTGEDKDAKRVLRGGSFLFRPIDCR
ncbi:MAG TPA: SUMF1/EgtB/PvdO family nonheme iron enzyme, partial [Planctomycetota bacterium]|nr:SUMF1/EgtB/PvdO family nonheme iron enzyme [Planctomycetota bacterium]